MSKRIEPKLSTTNEFVGSPWARGSQFQIPVPGQTRQAK